MMLRYLSLFSGIEAATVAWRPLGWECAAVAEIEPFPCAVLAHHYPHVVNLGDVTRIDESDIAMLGPLDIVVFGSPCQDLSVAGKRAGLQGERSGLFFDAIRIIGWARKWCGVRFAIWENVPGAFSSNKGRDFAVVVSELAGSPFDPPPKGWGNEGAAGGEAALVEWSTLDAQWFGVAQRRRRVFAVADFGDWTSRCPILLEPESLRGDSAPRREAGQGIAGTLTRRLGSCSPDEGERGTLIGCGPDIAPTLAYGGGNTSGPITVAAAVNAGGTGRLDFDSETLVTHALRADGFDASEDGTGQGTPLIPVGFPARLSGTQRATTEDLAPALGSANPTAVMTLALRGRGDSPNLEYREDGTANAVLTPNGGRGGIGVGAVMAAAQVRRLTPRECERLQAFPDNYTLILNKQKPVADGPRYKALGNSMCTKVMRWIGRQIELALLF